MTVSETPLTVTEPLIASLEGFKQTSAKNIINSVNNSKKNDLSKLIFALGIRHIGAKAGKLLADHFKNIDAIMNASVDDILEIDGFGVVMAQSVVEFFESDSSKELIEKLKEPGRAETVRADRGRSGWESPRYGRNRARGRYGRRRRNWPCSGSDAPTIGIRRGASPPSCRWGVPSFAR